MTKNQTEKIRLTIKKNKAALAAEKRKFGGFDDSWGRRYYISYLYMSIQDYKGVITYKRWFDKNFPDDAGSALLSLSWAIAYYETGKIAETKIYTIDTALKNVYLHNLLLGKEVSRIDMDELGHYDLLTYTKSNFLDFKKVSTHNYLDWLKAFMDIEEYKKPVNKFIALSKLLKDENNVDKRREWINYIMELENENINKNK